MGTLQLLSMCVSSRQAYVIGGTSAQLGIVYPASWQPISVFAGPALVNGSVNNNNSRMSAGLRRSRGGEGGWGWGGVLNQPPTYAADKRRLMSWLENSA